jgi:hypothetical protein
MKENGVLDNQAVALKMAAAAGAQFADEIASLIAVAGNERMQDFIDAAALRLKSILSDLSDGFAARGTNEPDIKEWTAVANAAFNSRIAELVFGNTAGHA